MKLTPIMMGQDGRVPGIMVPKDNSYGGLCQLCNLPHKGNVLCRADERSLTAIASLDDEAMRQ